MQFPSALSFETLHDTIEYILDGQDYRCFEPEPGTFFIIHREEDLVCLAQVRESQDYPIFDPLVMVALENGQALPLRCSSEKHGKQDARAMKGDWKAREELLMFIGLWLKTLGERGLFSVEEHIH